MPVDVKAPNHPLQAHVAEGVRRRARLLFGRHAKDVLCIDVTISDENGDKGGIDKRAVARVLPRRSDVCVAVARAPHVSTATSLALQRALRVLRRRMQRRIAAPRGAGFARTRASFSLPTPRRSN